MEQSSTSDLSDAQRVMPLFRFQPAAAAKDLLSGLAMWRIWLSLSWHEFASTYRRSALGVLWVILSFSGFVTVKLIIFSSLLESDAAGYYNTYLVLGFFIWMYLQQSITAAPDTFISVSGWICSEPLPFSIYIYKSVMREFYNLALTSIVVVVAIFFIGYPVKPTVIFCVPAIAFLLLNAVFYKLLLGIVSARVRDVTHLIKAVMLPMMFLTPIFWTPDQMPGLMKYLWWNPLFHFIEIFRAPLIDGDVPVTSWIFSGVVFLIVAPLSFVLFARFRQRIVFWF